MVNTFRNELCGSPEGWEKMKYVYADFLVDYYLDYDHLYLTSVPDFDVLKYRYDKGTLTAFNFSYFGADSAANIAHCQPAYEKAKELGILDHAYIYGFDECGDDQFTALEKSASDLKKAFPEVPIITTALDRSFGQDTAAKSIDAWCPLTPVYNISMEQADKARKAGKKVWWYIACIPGHPFANWWVEYPAIDARLLMGAMATKFKPDGFLYYALALWWKTPLSNQGRIRTGTRSAGKYISETA
jgi:hypothetical protein